MKPRQGSRSSLRTVLSILTCTGLLIVTQLPAHADIADAWFDFERIYNSDSDLQWRTADSNGRRTVWKEWRAGSGDSTDECDKYCGGGTGGWLPGGWYKIKGHSHQYDGTIKGRVWALEDKKCYNGTWRTELFFHTEETRSRGQACDGNSSTDNPYCWDNWWDHESKGCIKLSRPGGDKPYPDTIGNVDWYWHNRNTPISYPMYSATYVH